MKKNILAVSLALIFTAQASRAQAPNTETATDWRIKLNQELPLLGHRNWIMIRANICHWRLIGSCRAL
jgi:hypothetical protein